VVYIWQLAKFYTAQMRRIDKYVTSMEQRHDLLVQQNRQLKAALKRSAARSTIRGEGPNVRDVALGFLQKSRGPQPITVIADAVRKVKGSSGGANFVQNLGAALQRDKRFKRASRGVYGLRTPRGGKK
jgi:hypothetical protein